MSLPASVAQVPVVAGYVYRDAEGTYPSGVDDRIVFTCRTKAVVVDGETVTLPSQLVATLDATGEIPATFKLPTAGDDGIYYDVNEDFPGGRAKFTILVLTTDTSINLATAAPQVPPEDLNDTRGPAGVGVPAGGVTGQVMVKASNTDYDMAWGNPGDASVTNSAVNTAIEVDPAASRTALGLGAAATADTAEFATAAQGAKADTAVQPSGLTAYAPLASPTFTGTPAAPTAALGTNTTQLATMAALQAAIANLLGSAPGALDTLNELAAALGDDPNFATTVTNALALKANTADLGTAATTDATAYATAAQGTTADNALPAASVSSFALTVLDDTDAASARTTLGAAAATDVIPSINAQTGTSYTAVLADRVVTMDNAAANTFTVPASASVAYAVGTALELWQAGAGQTTIVADTGVTILYPSDKTLKLRAQHSGASLRKVGTDTWRLVGDLEDA